MTLEIARHELGWPSAETIFQPSGSGAAVVAELARVKIQQRISKMDGGNGVRVGILAMEPDSNATQAPLALVCDFPRPAPLATLHRLHRLAWNFSHTSLLITVEPHRLRAFTCCQSPERQSPTQGRLEAEIQEAEYRTDEHLSDRASAVLHWINLASGQFQRRFPERFDRNKTADNTLLDNLKAIRKELKKNGLQYDLIHDLLARLIFVQFLFQRCDSNGTPALNPAYLQRLHQRGILSRPHRELGGILGSHKDTYALFRYLDKRFNGDLFPGKKSAAETEREQEWRNEMDIVQQKHLSLLADFIQGKMKIRSGQYALWPLYSFDTIPLAFISSIYEAFVSKRPGTVYTPTHLVDFILDGVLPWEGTDWNLKILDPACGSGIFLVRAFQRLVYRWKQANPDTPIRTELLKRLLTHNLTGVDIDPHAVRVASFSLYLAMCDEIDPRHYWQQVQFPALRGKRLIAADFFSEEIPGLHTEADAGSYDLVIGNPPWGRNLDNTIREEFGSDAAQQWIDTYKKYTWPVSYGDIGPLFSAKSVKLTASSGRVAMLQPVGILFNQLENARKLRHKIFEDNLVEEVVNLSAVRFNLFKKAIGPSIVLTLRPGPVEQRYMFRYIVVKPNSEEDYRFVIEPYDIHEVHNIEAVKDSRVLTALIWGGGRDLALLRYFARFPTLGLYYKEGKINKREGIIRGNRKKEQTCILERKIFEAGKFPEEPFLTLDSEKLPINNDPFTHYKDSTDFSAFAAPQLLVKQGWQKETGRIRAMRVIPEQEGILCSSSYVTIHALNKNSELLDAACLSLNSRLATYYLFLSSGRFANYRPEASVADLLHVPCPHHKPRLLDEVQSFNDVDRRVTELFELKEAEQILVDDLLDYALPFFKDGEKSPACRPTSRGENEENDLVRYCEWFLRVLKAAFGPDKPVCATVFEELDSRNLPVRLAAIHLNWPGCSSVKTEKFAKDQLAEQLLALQSPLGMQQEENSISFRRIVRIFDTLEQSGVKVPTVFIAKPDEARYWTRSMAMRDADEIALEIMTWQKAG
ncbi:MAG: N-6 DNA methylase [Gammaproteobacteria bacterium]|nr:N-6 DNA methylase [Gammaproteobacteria bacterium]